jgi:hypothetical protein
MPVVAGVGMVTAGKSTVRGVDHLRVRRRDDL